MSVRFGDRLRAILCGGVLLVPQVLCAENDVLTAPDGVSKPAPTVEGLQLPDAREREIGAGEDPLFKRRAGELKRRLEGVAERAGIRPYGSVRIRYREFESESIWSDGGSRIGLSGTSSSSPGYALIGRVEAGVNLLDQAGFIFSRSDRPQEQSFSDTIFLRLLYAGAETDDFVLTAGKNWSTYYRVASFTDQFQGTGASASGTYNAGTDGGNTGTGRADRTLQARLSPGASERERLFRPLDLGLQIQHGEPIPKVPGKDYRTTLGLSSIYQTDRGLAVGIAYNHANIDGADRAALEPSGIDGDATALVFGARWFGEDWYVGTVVSRLENHETTGEGIYFDGTGWELYSHHRLLGPWWAVAGWNKLQPDASEIRAGAFRIDYGVLGIRYSFEGFEKMIFANVRFESGKTQRGLDLGNVYTIGMRWDLP